MNEPSLRPTSPDWATVSAVALVLTLSASFAAVAAAAGSQARYAATAQVAQSECERKAAARATMDCVSCESSVACLERVNACGGNAEIIPIAQGLMVIYQTPNVRRVGEVQTAALERWEIMDRIMAGKAEGHLCASCCAARQLMLRADRQVYRTSNGVVAMITSDDFTIVRELHRMAPKRRVVAAEP